MTHDSIGERKGVLVTHSNGHFGTHEPERFGHQSCEKGVYHVLAAIYDMKFENVTFVIDYEV